MTHVNCLYVEFYQSNGDPISTDGGKLLHRVTLNQKEKPFQKMLLSAGSSGLTVEPAISLILLY